MNFSRGIDSHVHFWKYTPERYPWISDAMAAIRKDFFPQDLKPPLDRSNFEFCIAVQAVQEEDETEFLLNLAEKNEFIKAVVGWIDLNSENVAARLNHFSENPKFKGIRHTVWDKKGEFMESAAFRSGINQLQQYNLTFDLLVFDYQLNAAIDLVAAFPNQKFVLNHLGNPKQIVGPTEDWIFKIRKISKYKNVHCKISGLFANSDAQEIRKEDIFPFLDVVSEAFRTERLLFGSNWPVCLVKTEYKRVVEMIHSYFSENEKERVLRENALNFYNLK